MRYMYLTSMKSITITCILQMVKLSQRGHLTEGHAPTKWQSQDAPPAHPVLGLRP